MEFSIIVPIYKVEKYLARCINSVLSQSCGDFELILVDDGSPDNCPKICDDFAKLDARVKVIHKENGGLVSARQAGTTLASGEYIYNLDGDDALFPDFLQNAHDIINETGADIISFSYVCVRDGKECETVNDFIDEGLYRKEDIINRILPEALCDENMQHLIYFLCGKAIKRSLVTEPQLAVPADKIILGEDICCLLPSYMKAETVYVSRKKSFLYTIRNDSLSTDFNINHFAQLENVILFFRELKPLYPKDFSEQISRYSCYMFFAILAAAAENGRFDLVGDIKKLMSRDVYKEEIPKSHFKEITLKSKVTVALLKKNLIGLAFYFLYFCKCLKSIIGKAS